MVINGREIAQAIIRDAISLARKLKKPLRLAAVLAGNDTNSRKFLERKKSAAEKVGIGFRLYEFPAGITTRQLRKKVTAIAKAQVNTGIIIELPLPAHINTQYILNAVPEEKDPDVLSQKAQGSFFCGRSEILPPAVAAIATIFQEYKIKLPGKNCVVFGYGLLVGKPVSHWLASQGATVSLINEFTPNPGAICAQADIIVAGVDQPKLITADMVKAGAVVIDFAKAVDFENVSQKAAFITPPTDGVGPLVIAAVFRNLTLLNKKTAK